MHIARGRADREIAREVGVSPHTIRYYITAAMQATGARSRAQLVAVGYATQLLAPGVWPPELTSSRCVRLATVF